MKREILKRDCRKIKPGTVMLGLMIIAVEMTMPGCNAIKTAGIGIASNGTVIKIESTGGSVSGTVAPNVLFGTVQSSIASAPAMPADNRTQVAIAYTESQSGLAAVFGHTAVTRTFSYVGLPSETAEQSKVRLEAVAKVLMSNALCNGTAADEPENIPPDEVR